MDQDTLKNECMSSRYHMDSLMDSEVGFIAYRRVNAASGESIWIIMQFKKQSALHESTVAGIKFPYDRL